MAVTFTNEEVQYIVEQVLNAIRSESQSVDELATVSSLDGINSLPALQGQTVVKAPILLLGQPAIQAAQVAYDAANLANAKANYANQQALNAEIAVVATNEVIAAANEVIETANEAAENANHAASFSVRRITTIDKDGQIINELIPDEAGNVNVNIDGGGSGNGFYNITQEHPLAAGSYYSKDSAMSALYDADIENEVKPGMIITFEESAGKWVDYRFEGTNINSFYTSTAWNRFGGGDAVRKLTVTEGTSTQEIVPDEHGNVNLSIPVLMVDQTLEEGSTNPTQGGAVKAAISELESQFGCQIVLNTIGEGDDVAYSLSLLDKNGEVLNTTETFTGGGGGGVSVSSKVILTRITPNPTVKFGDSVNLQFLYDQINTSDSQSTGNSAKATISIIYGATTTIREMTIYAGATTKIDVSPFLGNGSNTVRVRIITNDDLAQVSTISWTVKTIQLNLASSFNIASAINRGQIVYIPFSLTGSGDKTLRCYINGIDTEDRTINTSSANGSFQINTAGLTHGSHSVQLVAELELADGTIIKSNSIYFDIAVRVPGVTLPVFATRFDYQDGRIIPTGHRPSLLVSQYDVYTLAYAVYNLSETPTLVNVFEGGQLISSASVAFVRNDLTVRAMVSGIIQGFMSCGSTNYTYTLEVSDSELAIDEPVDNMTLKLSAVSRSNNDVNRAEWTFNSVQTLFSSFKWGGDGWLNGALRLTDDARATVLFQPLAQPEQNASGALAFMIRFKVTNIMDEEALIIRCMDESGVGLAITTQEARMVSSGNSTVTTKFAAGEIYNIGFVAYPQATAQSTEDERLNDNMLYLYVNGILSGGVQRGASDSIYQQAPTFIEMGSNECTLDIYSMRAYSVALTDMQMLDAYMIDLGGADELIRKYNENAILDANGQISVDSIRLPYMIVTGQGENGVSTLLQAAINNNKDPKYNVDEMLFVHPDDQARNFRCVGGCIRLQGTSSMAYPVKNYRIYFKNAQKQAGDLYFGCDSRGVGGVLQATAKYSLRPVTDDQKQSAPVDCFCMKADYAESSSSHNTGMTKLVHRVLKAAGDNTPPQQHVSESYPYDVRTCIDGYPCLLFYRNTVDEQPVFLGKYNFNNDKSTEAVFGFTGIPGYHDAEWIDVFGRNPTECWEFLNNDYPMGSFLDDDFSRIDSDGKPHWMKVFEARYPDDDDINASYESGSKPSFLKYLVEWVKSTNTAEIGLTSVDIQNRQNKFRNELSNYFDVPYLCDYYMLTEVFGCVDQRVKNMMLAFWYKPEADKVLAYMIFYDCDTILGLRNDGRLKYNWDLDHNTVDTELSTPGNTVYAYAGHNSVLWNNLRELFPSELAAAYTRIRSVMSNDFVFDIFDNEQSSRFNERIYNMDALSKYVTPKTLGIDVYQNGNIVTLLYSYLEAMQGSRKAHRRWWLTNRLSMFDARYLAGQYKNTDLTFKGNSSAGATIRAVASRDFYFAFVRESAVLSHSKVLEGQQWSYTYNQIANVGTIFHFYGGEYAGKIDLSDWGGFTDLNIPRLARLEELTMGKVGKSYGLTEIAIGDKLPMLRILDVRNYTNLPSLDLSFCTRLTEVNASGCITLSNIKFAEGCPLELVHLPDGYRTLTLRSLPQITRSGITFDNRTSLTGLWVDNCSQIDGFALMKELLLLTGNQLRFVRITGLKMTGDGSDLQAWYNAGLGGFDSQGNTSNKCKLVGTYRLTKYLDESMYNLLVNRFDELNIRQPQYTMIEFDDRVAADDNISNLDNGTGYKFGNKYMPSAHISRILERRFRCLGKQATDGIMTIYPLHNSNSNYYADANNIANCTPAVLNGSEGDVWMREPKYWYKGINDYLNNRKYACFSADDKQPDVPQCTIVSYDEILTSGNVIQNKKLLIGFTTIASSLSNDTNYSVCKVNVSGRLKVRFPTTLGSSLVGSAFSDANGNIVSTLTVPPLNNKFSDGMYLIATIPSGAVYLHFTILKVAEFDKVVLTDSDRIEDMEPEWVEHKECLTGVFETMVIGSSLSSVITGGSSVGNLTKPDFSSYAAARKLQLVDYEMSKDVANLFFAKYGRRDAQDQCGYGQNNHMRITGTTAFLGMNDTVNQNKAIEYAWYPITDDQGQVTYVRINNVNCMGYEDWFGNKAEWMDKVSIPNATTSEQWKWYIEMPDGTIRKVRSGTSSGYINGVVHQKFMDTVPVGGGDSSQTTHYCDYGGVSNSVGRVVYRSSFGAYPYGGVSCAVGGSDSSYADAVFGSRLAFRGQIAQAGSVPSYKALLAIA